MSRTLVIGIGNELRGDDRAGLEAARRVRARRPDEAIVLERSGDAASLMEAWLDRPRVILVDAMSSGERPGTVRRFEAHAAPLPSGLLHTSTHSWGVAEAVEMARALGQLPPCLVVYGLEGRSFGWSRHLSPEVEAAVRDVVERVLEELAVASPA